MDAVQVVCPSGLFPLPARCDAELVLPSAACAASSQHAVSEQQLLDQLQGLCVRANRLLTLISIHREQGVVGYDQELHVLCEDALTCIQQTLQLAAAAKQPLLLVSSQHTSCFCELLERLHLVDVLRSSVQANEAQTADQPALPTAEEEQRQNAEQTRGRGATFISRLEQQLQAVSGIDAVLAALALHCQQNLAAGSKLSTGNSSTSSSKPEAIEVACLSSIQEQHSSARALPLLLRLYFTNNSRAETIAAGKPEHLNTKLLERCIAQLAAKPVVPGFADMPLCLPHVLDSCQGLQEVLAARKLKLPVSPGVLDDKAAAKVDQSYSLQPKLLPLLQQHDELCDLLSQLALEVKQAVAVDRDIDSKAFANAEQLVVGSINFVSAAKNSLLELDAWRLAQRSARLQRQTGREGQADSSTAASCDRYALLQEDVVPFMDILGASKGLTGLLADSSSWLQLLLQVHTVKQLHEFAASTLPALAKLYPRNKRVQTLLKAAYASMQGQLVELKDDTYLPSYATSAAGDVQAPLTPTGYGPTAATAADEVQQTETLQRQSAGPVAEGFEGLKGRWSKRGASSGDGSKEQQRAAGIDGAASEADENESGTEEMLATAAAAAAAISTEAAAAAAVAASASRSKRKSRSSRSTPTPAQEQQQAEEELAELASAVAVAAAAAMETVDDGSSSALSMPSAAASQAAKKRWGKRIMKSIRSGKKGKPEPSPQPELCSAPAALAALEAMLSEAEREEDTEAGSSANAAAAAFDDDKLLSLGLRLRTRVAISDDESVTQMQQGDGSTFSSINSISAAFDKPPDLPWEASGAADAGDGLSYSPRSVAAAAAAFESRIAASRRTSRLSAPANNNSAAAISAGVSGTVSPAPVMAGALDLPNLSVPLPPHALETDELVEAAALELAESAAAGLAAEQLLAGMPNCSPRSARRFHFFKFKSILQHHEKLSTEALAAAAKAAAAAEGPEGAASASGEMGAGARIRAALSIRRRASAASATASVDDEAGNAAAIKQQQQQPTRDPAAEPATSGGVPAPSPRVTQPGTCAYDAVDAPTSAYMDAVDQPSKQGRVAGLMSRVMGFRQQGREQQGQAAAAASAPAGAAAGQQPRQGFKALNFTSKLKKAMVDRRQTTQVDGQARLQLEAAPSLACLLQLRVLLEQLMHEIKAETKKHLMAQLQLAAAAAAGSTGAKPDASIARPLRQVKAMIKAVHRMQMVLDYPRQLAAAADLSSLWLSRAYSSFFAGEQQQMAAAKLGGVSLPTAAGLNSEAPSQVADSDVPAAAKVLFNLLFEERSESSLGSGPSQVASSEQQLEQQAAPEAAASDAGTGQAASASASAASAKAAVTASFPATLLAGCMSKLNQLPAELPLLVLHLFWDARTMLQGCGLLGKGLLLLRQQEEVCMRCYIQSLVPAAYEHFKKTAAHQTVTYEQLRSCNAGSLQPVQPMYFDALLREPCPIVLQGDYTAVARAAESELSLPGAVLLRGLSLSGRDLGGLYKLSNQLPSGAQQAASQQQLIDELHQALQQMQDEQEEAEQLLRQQEYVEGEMPDDQQVLSRGPSPSPGSKAASAKPGLSPVKSPTHKSKRQARSKRRAGSHAVDVSTAVSETAGQTPLMQKLEQLELVKQISQTQQRQQVQALVEAEALSLVDVRQWLLAGLLASLKKDASAVVAHSRVSSPSAVVQICTQTAILQRAHQLISQYAALPCSWAQLWEVADAAEASCTDQDSCQSATVRATVAGLLQMVDTAAYDSEAQILLPPLPAAAAAGGADADGMAVAAAAVHVDGVLAEVSRALQPMLSYFGRQHLQALLALAGDGGQHHLLHSLMDKLDQEQVVLLDQLQQLQQHLPCGLLQLPPAEQCHNAGAVLQFYQQQLSDALADPGACCAALGSLQRIGNCLALLQLASVQQSVQATPVFMQVAPLLGVVGRPMNDAAAAAECFEYEGAPDPPSVSAAVALGSSSRSCAPGLLMPEVEQLAPSENARKAYEMQAMKELQQEQAWREDARARGHAFDESLIKPGHDLARHRVWQASYFQRLLLGPDAEMVRGPALLLTQTAELRAWKATQAAEYMGPCMDRVRSWATRLQRQLQGLSGEACEEEQEAAAAAVAAATCGSSQGQQGQEGIVLPAMVLLGQQQLQQQKQQWSSAGVLQEHAAVRCSLQGDDCTAPAVADIGVRDNTLYSDAATDEGCHEQQEEAEQQQQQQQQESSQSLEQPQKEQQQGRKAGEASGSSNEQPCQQSSSSVTAFVSSEARAAATAAAAEQQQQVLPRQAPGSCLSVGGSSISVRPSFVSSNTSRPYVSYDDDEDEALLTPPALQLDSLSSSPQMQGGMAAVATSTAVKSSNIAAAAATAPNFLTAEDLQAAAEAAAVAAAASLPSSPHASTGGNMGNPWEAAGAATAQLPVGSVAPAQAKLAYRALLDSTSQQQEGQMAAEAGVSGGATHSGRYGLAELVGEISDAVSSARSDTAGSQSHRALSSRQVHLHLMPEQQQQPQLVLAAGSCEQGAAGSEGGYCVANSSAGGRMKEKALPSGGGARSGPSSPRSPHRSMAGAAPDAAGDASDVDVASDSDVELADSRQQQVDWQHVCSPCGSPTRRQQQHSRLRQASTGGAANVAAARGSSAGAAAAPDPGSSRSTDDRSPNRGVPIPKLGLGSLGANNAAADDRPASGGRMADSSGRLRNTGSSRPGQEQQQEAQLEVHDTRQEVQCEEDMDEEGSYPAPNVNDLLFESTCTELVRVKDENNALRSELEMLKNQLQNRDTSLALLSGNLFTPRASERGITDETLPPTYPSANSTLSSNGGGSMRAPAPVSSAGGCTAASGKATASAAVQTSNRDRSLSPAAASGRSSARVSGRSAAAAAPSAATAAAEPAVVSTAFVGAIPGPCEQAMPDLSPEPSEIRPEASKISMRAQQPSPPESSSSSDSGDDSSSDGSSSNAADDSEDGAADGGFSATRKLKLPTAMRTVTGSSGSARAGSGPASQLAVALSALKFALILEVAKAQAGGASSEHSTSGSAIALAASPEAAAAATAGISGVILQSSPLKRLKKAALSTVTGSAAGTADAASSVAAAAASSAAAEQPSKVGSSAPEASCAGAELEGTAAVTSVGMTAGSEAAQQQPSAATAAAAAAAAAAAPGKTVQHQQQQYAGGSGCIAGGQYGDGPLLASAVLLQLAGQGRKHALLDATSRIAHWVEYDAVKGSTPGAAAAAAAADSSSGPLPAGLPSPGGIGASAVSGVAPPKPRSKKRQEEQAEEEARLKQQAAAQQQLLQRLAAAARQADRVAKDGSSLAAKFAPPAPAQSQQVKLKVFRVDEAALAAQRTGTAAAGAGAGADEGRLQRFSSGGLRSISQAGAAAAAEVGGNGSGRAAAAAAAQQHAVAAVPVRPELLEFAPRARPWSSLVPSQKPIQSHPALPMPRPRPLLLPNASAAAVAGQAGVKMAAADGLNPVAAAAAAAGGVVGPAGRLLPGVGVTANAGLVAAARAVHAREALLAVMPRTAVYSFSVMSDHNRSGRQEDGFSKAPSTADLDSMGEDASPRKRPGAAAAAASRLGGRRPAGMSVDQWTGGCSGSEQSSPTKSPSKSPSKRQQAGRLASLVGQ